MNFNQVNLGGNMCRDCELRYLPSQMAVGSFSIAVNRKWKDAQGQAKEEVTFVECTAWGKTAEAISKYLKKGSPIFVSGRLKLEVWEDKQGGGKRSKLGVVVESFQFIGGQRDGSGAGNGPAARPGAAQAPADSPIGNEQHFDESSIQF